MALKKDYDAKLGLYLSRYLDQEIQNPDDPKLKELGATAAEAFGICMSCLRQINSWDAPQKEKRESLALPLKE
jgi:hypothetical protein